ncbi:MAG TPA: ornithine cyclodeaminase family protein [Blastocatellia bacterium]|nr:ornithine cyclodeaminase family protein [Blastocatellia bacterium]
MKPAGTLLLTRSDVADLLSLDDCITAVEQAFKLHAEGKVPPPGILGMHVPGGGFHIKAASANLNRSYFAAKLNGNFYENVSRFGMPRIQGVIILCDAENGFPLAVMDSIEISIVRTGAATAVAAKYLSRPDSDVVTICGCGNQGRVSIRAISRLRPLKRCFAFDTDKAFAQRFADELSTELQIQIEPVVDLSKALKQSDICVTCTPSRAPYINSEDVPPGTFIAAVGSDSEEKQELNPALLAVNKVVVDITDQCATIGELHHAIDARLMTKADVHAELGEVIAGRKPGRASGDEVIIFDSTGTALQDVAAAAIVYERALATERYQRINFGD